MWAWFCQLLNQKGGIDVAAKIINLTEVRNKNIKSAAFRWAQSEQRRLGCVSDLIRFDVDRDWMVGVNETESDCILSIFVDDDTGRVLLRRDWLELMAVKYDILTNLEELRNIAPKSIEHMEENAIRLYHYFDGPRGGIYRYVGKPWALAE